MIKYYFYMVFNMNKTFEQTQWVWISHSNNIKTPSYANGPSFTIIQEKDQSLGDTCNQVNF